MHLYNVPLVCLLNSPCAKQALYLSKIAHNIIWDEGPRSERQLRSETPDLGSFVQDGSGLIESRGFLDSGWRMLEHVVIPKGHILPFRLSEMSHNGVTRGFLGASKQGPCASQLSQLVWCR